MKYFHQFVLFVLILTPGFSMAQVVDDFSDGDFTTNPTWSGDDVKFEVNAGFQLHLNAPALTDVAYLSTPSIAINNAVWDIDVELGFNPSSANRAYVFLVADAANMNNVQNGYFVMIGNTTDEVSLYSRINGTDTKIIDGRDGTLSTTNVAVNIRVTRDNAGNWELFSDTSYTSTFISEGSILENTIQQSSFFGVFCEYSSTRSDKFFFDNVNVTGTGFVDNTPPLLSSVSIISSNALDVQFNEPLDQVTAETTTNYLVDNAIGNPTSAVLDGTDPSLVHLSLASAFQNGTTYQININQVEDVANNAMLPDSATFLYFVPDTAVYRDVVINELYDDPEPGVNIPEAEYIELFNASNKTIDLTNWTVTDGTSTGTFGSYVLLPGEYVVICDNDDEVLFWNVPNKIVVTTLPTLNNTGDDVQLFDERDTLIDRVNYTDDWYHDPSKSSGGWTLEQINPYKFCTGKNNWAASVDVDHGTPGVQNSVYSDIPDTIGPEIESITVISANYVQVLFDEPLDSVEINNATFNVSNNAVINLVQGVSPDYDAVDVFFLNSLDSGVYYTLTVNNIKDCEGNNTVSTNGKFVLPFQGLPGDVIINELLYNPRESGTDFVELYNNSDKVIDLMGWSLANYDNDTIDNFKVINESFILNPEEFVVLSKDSVNVKAEYPFAAIGTYIDMSSLPSFPNDSGTVYIINNLNQVTDKFSYDDDMQFGMLNSTDGVTLERIDYNRDASDKTNWHSAAKSQNYGTPGYENSQFYPSDFIAGDITIEPEVFSPDNDMVDDVANIHFGMEEPGFVVNIDIYDAGGRLVKRLLKGELIGNSNVASWDGTNEQREKCRIGTYVVLIEVFDTEGNVFQFKRSVVLAGRL